MSKADVRPVVQQNHVDGVLQDYLDQLLITATTPAVVVPVVAPEPVRSQAEAATSERQETVVPALKTAVKPVALNIPLSLPELPSQPLNVPADMEIVDEPVTVVEHTASVMQASAALNWRSSQGIECLIFKVAGLKLAIPLPLLGGVHTVTDKVTPLFGQAAWSLGVWQGDDGKLTIIDSAQLIMPERGVQLRESGYQFFIQLDRSPWALACQEICDTVTLVYDSIKWRGEGSKRPWLAGTVIAEMCALLDVPGIMELLEQQRRPVGRNRP